MGEVGILAVDPLPWVDPLWDVAQLVRHEVIQLTVNHTLRQVKLLVGQGVNLVAHQVAEVRQLQNLFVVLVSGQQLKTTLQKRVMLYLVQVSHLLKEEVVEDRNHFHMPRQDLLEDLYVPAHRKLFDGALSLEREYLVGQEESLVESKLVNIYEDSHQFENSDGVVDVKEEEVDLIGKSLPLVPILLHEPPQNVFNSG